MEDGAGRLEVGDRLVEAAGGDQRLGAIRQAQPAEHSVAAEVGEPGGDVELGQGLGELAVFGEVRAIVAADPHELEEVVRPLGVLEAEGVVAMLGDVVAVDAGDHREHRVGGRQGLVVIGPRRQIEGLLGRREGSVTIATRPTDRCRPGQAAGVVGWAPRPELARSSTVLAARVSPRR